MQSTTLTPATSAEWRAYFERNRHELLVILWDLGSELTGAERWAVARSVQEFQRGESSEGRHLHCYARQYAAATGDWDYLRALELFIAEEQRHARDLGRFLTINGIPLVKATFTDGVFRRLRNLIGTLEISIAVLITAEIIAEVYYAVLQRATESRVLRRLCDQILRDERRHVQFQAQQLSRLQSVRGRWPLRVTRLLQRGLFAGACLVVWLFHRRALLAGGSWFGSFWRDCWTCYGRAFDGMEKREIAGKLLRA